MRGTRNLRGRGAADRMLQGTRLSRVLGVVFTMALLVLPTPALGESVIAVRAPATGPLPECRYADAPTRFTDPDDWRISLLDTIQRLPVRYRPPQLVPTARAGIHGGDQVRPEVIDDLRAMWKASKRADAEIAVAYGYRSFQHQASVFRLWRSIYGNREALRTSARAGHSEHQLGTALDFRGASSNTPPWEYPDWGRTAPGAWLGEHAWEYGFVLSYPSDQMRTSCYSYEPWHYRYVGREIAAGVHESGLTLREYLWTNYETKPPAPPTECCFLAIL